MRETSELELHHATAKKGAAQALAIVPGKIESYNPLTQTATARPCSDTLPILEGPVGNLGGGGARILHATLAKGDDCLIFLTALDPTNFFATGELAGGVVSEPYGARWAVIVPLKMSLPSVYLDAALSSDLRIGKDDGTSEIIFGDVLQLGSVAAIDPVAMNSLVIAAFATLVGVFNAHTHLLGGVPTGPPLTPAVPPVSVGSSKVVVDL